jgi:anaerobic selenocysteine-containing dehydrogenase
MTFGLLFRMIGEIRFGELQSSARGLILEPHEFGRFRARSVRGRGSKVRLAPQDLIQEAWKLEGYLSVRQAEQGRLLLIGMRERHTHNTWMHNADGLVGDATTNYLFIHPEDASARGMREGDLVEVDGLEGDRVRVPCRLTSDLKPGVIALPHGWGHNGTAGWQRANRRPGVNVNRLATDSVRRLEPVSGMAWLTGLPVEIRKVQEARLNSGHRE